MFRRKQLLDLLLGVDKSIFQTRGIKQKAKLNIILKEDVDNLGQTGAVLKVRHGFARNYLVPQKKAVIATHATTPRFARSQEDLQDVSAKERAKEEAARRMLGIILKRLTATPLEVRSRVRIGERLAEPVTAATIAAAAGKDRKIQLPEELVEMDEPVRELGNYGIPLRIVDSTGEQAYLRVSVLPLAIKDETVEVTAT